jgi:WD40 repeat protein
MFHQSVSVKMEKKIVSGSRDKTIRIWNTETNLQEAVLKGHTLYVSSVCISQDGKKIVSGSWDKTIRLWNTEIN